jgi:hypothetical protein
MKDAKKRTIMESLRIDEISGVDRPAQEGARALLIKRAESEEDAFEKMLKSAGLYLTSDEKGHSHLVDITDEGGTTSHNKASGAEFGHSHPWVKKNDGSIQIGMADGHGHDLMEKRFEPEEDEYSKRNFTPEQRRQLAKEGKAMPDGSYPIINVADLRNAIQAFGRAKNKGPVAQHIKRRARALGAESELPKEGALALKSLDNGLQKEQVPMAKENEKTVEAVEKQLQDVQNELAISKAYGSLTDAEKAHYGKLDSEGQTAFLDMDADGRKAELKKSEGENPVIYTSDDGEEFRKMDDPRLVKMAQKADREARIAKEEREKREDADLAKRADEELSNLPGEPEVKKFLLKAVDGIEDLKVREGVQALLKAGNENLSKAFTRIGEQGEPESTSLEAEYNKLAEEYAEKNEVSLVKAKAEVLTETEKGRDLAKRMEADRRSKGL